MTEATRRGLTDHEPRVIRPRWSVSPRLKAFTTTRLGGVSHSPFDSLNLGLHVGDDVEAVQENRRRLRQSHALPAEPHWLNQTHGTEILRIGESPKVEVADGAWTDRADTVLAVLTADCLPVVISTRDGQEMAVVHAGWRGMAAGILERAIEQFDRRAELHAWLGPAIGPDAFEVGAEVRAAFLDRDVGHAASFRPGRGFDSPSPDGRLRYWADIYSLARRALQRRRTVTVVGGDCCTVSQSQWFHSHRRDGAGSGRMATVVWRDASPA